MSGTSHGTPSRIFRCTTVVSGYAPVDRKCPCQEMLDSHSISDESQREPSAPLTLCCAASHLGPGILGFGAKAERSGGPERRAQTPRKKNGWTANLQKRGDLVPGLRHTGSIVNTVMRISRIGASASGSGRAEASGNRGGTRVGGAVPGDRIGDRAVPRKSAAVSFRRRQASPAHLARTEILHAVAPLGDVNPLSNGYRAVDRPWGGRSAGREGTDS